MDYIKRIKKFFEQGIKNETTGSYLNYYTMHINDPAIRNVLNNKFNDNFDIFYWLLLPFNFIAIIMAIVDYTKHNPQREFIILRASL